MKTKQLIYVGLAAMLFSSSLINVPAQVSAAESTATSSSTNTSQSIDSEVTSGATESSRQVTGNQDSSSIKDEQTSPTSQSVMMAPNTKPETKEDTTTPPPAPTVDGDGAYKPNWDALWIIFTLRTGFRIQPQEQQYIVANDVPFFNMQIARGATLFSTDMNVYKWEWKNNKWEKSTLSNGKTESGGQLQDLSYHPSEQLGTGYYYFQFSFKTGIWPLQSTYNSKLAGLTITDVPYPATKLEVSAPTVAFPNVGYNANAGLTPTYSTDQVEWVKDSTGAITYLPEKGRKTIFTVDKSYANKVNTNTELAGAPVTVAAKSYSDKEGNNDHSDSASVAVGGLPAREVAQDAGLKWPVSGLADLATASASANPWTYQWTFYDGDGKKLKTQPSAASGAVNDLKGTVDSLDQVNNDDKILTFTKDSSFMKDAAAATASGKSYRAQVEFTTTASDEEKSRADNKITVDSNIAELRVNKPTGALTLDKVPSFAFGNVEASSLYGGIAMASSKFQASDTLQVTDTRATPGWDLSATMSKMTATNSDTLNDTSIYISGLPDAKTATITDDNVSTDIIASKTTGSWPVTGRLGMKANPNLNLTKDENFKSDITWTLTSTAPVTKALK